MAIYFKIKTMPKDLQNLEMLEASTFVSTCVNECSIPVTEQYLLGNVAGLKGVTKVAADSYNREMKLSLAEELDGGRDVPFSCVVRLVEVFSDSSKPALRTAALQLMPVVDRYRGTAQMSLDAESAAIRRFLDEMKSTENTASVQVLPELTTFLNDVDTAQTAFEAQRHSFIHEVAQRKASGSTATSSYRKQIYALINNAILPDIELKANADPDTWLELARRLDTYFRHLADIVKARKAAKKTDKGEAIKPGQGDDVAPTDEPNPNPGTGSGTDQPGKPGTGSGSSSNDDDSMPSA